MNEDVDWIGMVGTVEGKLLRRTSLRKSMRFTCGTHLFANVEQGESHDGSGCQQVLI